MQNNLGGQGIRDSFKWIYCQKCKYKLLRRLKGGALEFVFGSGRDQPNGAPVQMRIHGRVEMKCFRKKCGHWNIIVSS